MRTVQNETFDDLPATFIVAGSNDELGAQVNSFYYWEKINGHTDHLEIHFFDGAPHGFGTAGHFTGYWERGAFRGADSWMDQAVLFMDVVYGYESRTYE